MIVDTLPPAPGFVSVTDAARRLGVTESRVRQLIGRRELRAQNVRGLWLVQVEDVERRKALAPAPGRRLTPARVWGLLYLAAGLPAPWLDRSARYRLRSLLKARRLTSLRSRLTARGVPLAMRAHPSQLRSLRDEPLLMLTGPTAAAELRLGLLAGEVVEAYVDTDRLDELVRRYHLRASREPNVLLRVVPTFAPEWPPAHHAPLSAIALDLIDDPDPRTREVGLSLLDRIDR